MVMLRDGRTAPRPYPPTRPSRNSALMRNPGAVPLPLPLYIRYPRLTVKLSVRLRRGGWLIALLMAALLVVPAVDCSLVREHTHSDNHHAVDSAETSASDAGLAEFFLPTATTAHCDVDTVHCLAKALPPGVVSLTLAAMLLAAFAAVMPISPTPPAGGVGVRGPPGQPPGTRGRNILSLHCIARR